MRAIIITVLIFIFMCCIIFANNIYIKETAEFICECVSEGEFERDPSESIQKLDEFWQKNHPIVGLSVGYKELDRMSDLIIDLKVYHELGNTAEVLRVRALIIETADEISRLEKFELENLL